MKMEKKWNGVFTMIQSSLGFICSLLTSEGNSAERWGSLNSLLQDSFFYQDSTLTVHPLVSNAACSFSRKKIHLKHNNTMEIRSLFKTLLQQYIRLQAGVMAQCQKSRMEKGSSSSSSSSSSAGPPDSLIGLKFGKKIYFEGTKTGGAPPPEAPPPPSPAKKGRTAAVQGGQPPRCQVEGCRLDLTDAKAYYSRHKVCGMHSKSPKVIVAGLEQRFCQQCSRFHQLPEFDQGKRSCRRRLAGHNERRRKPPPGSLLSPRYGSFSPSSFEDRSKTGGFVMDFSAYPALTGRESWPNASSERGMGNQVSITGKYQLPLQSNSTNPLSSYSGPGVSSEGCFNGVSDSNNALSLLSTQPWGSRSRSTSPGASNFLGTNGAAMVHPHPSVNPGATIGQFAFSQSDGALHEMPPDLGLGQTSHAANNEFIGELGLAQPNEGHFHDLDHSRGYDDSLHYMHWSL